MWATQAFLRVIMGNENSQEAGSPVNAPTSTTTTVVTTRDDPGVEEESGGETGAEDPEPKAPDPSMMDDLKALAPSPMPSNPSPVPPPSEASSRIRRGSTVSSVQHSPIEPPEVDLSHLSEDERATIAAVMERARKLQEEENQRIRSVHYHKRSFLSIHIICTSCRPV